MNNLESLIESVFSLVKKAYVTFYNLSFYPEIVLNSLFSKQSKDLLDSKVYLALAIFLMVILNPLNVLIGENEYFKDGFLGDVSKKVSELDAGPVVIIAILCYVVMFVIGKTLRLSKRYFELYLNYGVLWIGNTLIWIMIWGISLILLEPVADFLVDHHLLRNSNDIVFTIAIDLIGPLLIAFLIASSLKGAVSIGVFSRIWLKFSTISVFVLFLSLTLKSYSIEVVTGDVMGEIFENVYADGYTDPPFKFGTHVPDDKLILHFKEGSNASTPEYIAEVALLLFNDQNDNRVYLKNIVTFDFLNIDLPMRLKIENSDDLVLLEDKEIKAFTFKASLSKRQFDYLDSISKHDTTKQACNVGWDVVGSTYKPSDKFRSLMYVLFEAGQAKNQ